MGETLETGAPQGQQQTTHDLCMFYSDALTTIIDKGNEKEKSQTHLTLTAKLVLLNSVANNLVN